MAYSQAKDVHIGNSSHVLVAYDNDKNDDIASCAKYKGRLIYNHNQSIAASVANSIDTNTPWHGELL
jgi:hypothetical protein